VGTLDQFSIPVTMTTAGCPVLFQMVSHDPSLAPIVRFGCVVEAASPITRRTRLLNRSASLQLVVALPFTHSGGGIEQ